MSMSQPAAIRSRLPAHLHTGPQPSATHRQPRRPLAHASVSLKRSPLSTASRVSSPGEPPSNASSLINNKASPGESSNADCWFENSNYHVRGGRASFAENDSPFYCRTSSNESPPYPPQLLPTNPVVSYRPGRNHVNSNSSSSEEYRSVIDDLTIQNKMLKKRLKRFEIAKDKQLQSDRLFEVKIHGLPPAKKRELDDMLSNFAVGLNSDSPCSMNSSNRCNEPQEAQLAVDKSGESLTSLKCADSGYGSAAASGQMSTSHSGLNNLASTPNPASVLTAPSAAPAQISKAKNLSIQSYLHEIPAGLLPSHSMAMTEKTRKKLVVRRLEQVFAGSGAADEGHQLPLQQQEVSQSAASADRRASEAEGQRVALEGMREGRIMEFETEHPTSVKDDGGNSAVGSSGRLPVPTDLSGDRSPEQRPTRPLDLDPHRAQVPAENMQYFRHLGFQVPDSAHPSGIDVHGWIYLNLLSNMAQLHTINVTVDFVKKALTEYSARLELSSDGRKVRWKGGRDLTTYSSSSSVGHLRSNQGSPDSESSPSGGRKRVKLSSGMSGNASKDAHPSKQQGIALFRKGPENKFAYKPLFYRRETSSDSDDGSEMEFEPGPPSSYPEGVTGVCSGQTSNVLMPASPHRRREDGPIVFYNNAKFCTDLSGDPREPPQARSAVHYALCTSGALGATPSCPRSLHRMFSNRNVNPLVQSRGSPSTDEDDMESSDEDTASLSLGTLSAHLDFPSTSPKHATFAETATPFDLEASGIGGIRPADNLAITVVRQHRASPHATLPRPRTFPTKSSGSRLQLHKASTSVDEGSRIVATHSRTLLPSALPAPSYVFASSEFESDPDDDDDDADDSDASYSSAASPSAPSSALHRGQSGYFPLAPLDDLDKAMGSSNDDGDVDDDDDDDDDEDDDEVDMLATARKIDPVAVMAREREYDAVERLANEILPGSSAATAGGWSGFSSPVLVTLVR